MANYVYIATSIDGFIADKDGGVDWLEQVPNPNQDDCGWAEFIQNIDAIVMGRNSFDTVLKFGTWPYDRPVFVLSRSLDSIPDSLEGKAFLMSGEPQEVTDALREKGYENLYIDGGVVVQQFLNSDLIDHLIITTIPVVLGDGIPLFGKTSKPLKFEYVKTDLHLDALVKRTYRRMK